MLLHLHHVTFSLTLSIHSLSPPPLTLFPPPLTLFPPPCYILLNTLFTLPLPTPFNPLPTPPSLLNPLYPLPPLVVGLDVNVTVPVSHRVQQVTTDAYRAPFFNNATYTLAVGSYKGQYPPHLSPSHVLTYLLFPPLTSPL